MMSKIILVVDKEHYWREFARVALVSRGWDARFLDDYARLHKALAQCPDVVLLGFSVIESREEEIVHKTLESCPRAIVLVLVTSQLTPQATERRMLRWGVTNVAERPSSPADLANLVEEAIEGAPHDHQSTCSHFSQNGVK